MRCPKCNTELEPGSLYCRKCGQEVQIVPDYDPLDDLVIGEDGDSDSIKEDEKTQKKEPKPEPKPEQKKSGDEISTEGKKGVAAHKGLWLLCGILLCFLIFLASYFSIIRENSFSYQMRKGIAFVEQEEYEEALSYLKHAEELQEDSGVYDLRPQRYLAKAYAGIGAGELAVDCMKRAIRLEDAWHQDAGELETLYLEMMDILNQTHQTAQIEKIIKSCNYEEIRKELEQYLVEKPVCNVPEGVYHQAISLELKAEYGEIYYTLDGTEPTTESIHYDGPIRIGTEETLLTAVAINEKGMISEKLVLVYKLEP